MNFKASKEGMRLLSESIELSDAYAGYCKFCGHRHEGVSPDARRIRCDSCGRRQVFGAAELWLVETK